MGGPPTPGGGGGGGGGGTTNDFSGVISKLQEILDLLRLEIDRGALACKIDILTLAGAATFQALYPNPKIVRRALIQNISTENVTITTDKSGQTAAQGILLTKANAAGEGGGSLPVGNIDLATLYFVRTTNGVTLAIYYEV